MVTGHFRYITGTDRERLKRRVAALYARGLTLHEVAAKINRSYGLARNLLRESGATARPPGRFVPTGEERDRLRHEVAQMHASGASIQEITRRTNRTFDLIRKLLDEAGVPRRRESHQRTAGNP